MRKQVATLLAGLVKITIEEAEMYSMKKGKEYFAVISVGNQVWLGYSFLAILAFFSPFLPLFAPGRED